MVKVLIIDSIRKNRKPLVDENPSQSLSVGTYNVFLVQYVSEETLHLKY